MMKNYISTLALLISAYTLNAQSWIPVNTDLPALTARGLAKIDDTLFVGIEDGGFFFSVDNGDSWQTNVLTDALTHVGLNRLAGMNTNMGVPGGAFFVFGQSNLQYYEQGLPGGLQSLNVVVTTLPNQEILSFGRTENPGRGFYCTEAGLYYTEDGVPAVGNEATGLSGDALVVNDIFDNDVQVLIGTNAGLYSSTDNGTSFTLDDSSIPATERVYQLGGFTATSNGVYFLMQEGPVFMPIATGGDYRCTFWDAAGTSDAFFFGDNVGSRMNGQTFVAAPMALDGITGGIILSTAVIGNYVFVCTETGGVFRYDLAGGTVGLDDQTTAQPNISVFPNPSNGTFVLNGLANGNYTIDVLDMAGRTLQTMQTSNHTSISFDLSTMPEGMYLVRTQNANGVAALNKVVVSK